VDYLFTYFVTLEFKVLASHTPDYFYPSLRFVNSILF
jgi:hypothetical protein